MENSLKERDSIIRLIFLKKHVILQDFFQEKNMIECI